MAVKYLPQEYLYLSARLRAKESGIVGKERLARFCAMPEAEILSTLAAEGFFAPNVPREAALLQMLRDGFSVLCEAPDPHALAFLRYPYDAHNLKTALKCHILSRDPSPLYLDVGTVPVSELAGVPTSVPDSLPVHLREAVEKAYHAYLQNKDPREIDFLLDAACFADMSECNEIPLAVRLVALRADVTNLRTCRRLLAMQAGGMGEGMLRRAFLPGGTLTLDALLALYGGGEEEFFASVAKGEYARVFEKDDPAEIDRAAEDLYLCAAREGARVPFGAEVVIGYVIGIEYAVKNLRILLVAKETGEDTEGFNRRLRESYV